LKRQSCSLRNENFSYAERRSRSTCKDSCSISFVNISNNFIVIFGPITISFIKNGFWHGFHFHIRFSKKL
jgi:hypothetical protein